MKSTIGILLIFAALLLGYLGVNQIRESANSVEVMGIQLSAEDKGAKETGYIELALGVVALGGGIYLVNKGKK